MQVLAELETDSICYQLFCWLLTFEVDGDLRARRSRNIVVAGLAREGRSKILATDLRHRQRVLHRAGEG